MRVAPCLAGSWLIKLHLNGVGQGCCLLTEDKPENKSRFYDCYYQVVLISLTKTLTIFFC